MYRFLYNIPLFYLIIAAIVAIFLWGFLKSRYSRLLIWRLIHLGLLLLWTGFMLYFTVIGRTTGNGGVNLTLFWSYRKVILEGSYDFFQEIYLNVGMFVIGSVLAAELFMSKKWKFSVIIFGVLFSITIEMLQYTMDVGLAEFDDVFSNFMGSAIGLALNILAQRIPYDRLKAYPKGRRER